MRLTSRLLPLFALLSLLPTGPEDAFAQQIDSGDRVRLHAAAPQSRPITGTLAFGGGDTLILRSPSGSLTIPAGSVRVLEASRGRRRVLWGAAGSAAGALLGLVVAPALLGPETGNDLDRFRHDLVRIDLAAKGMLVGVAAGAVIGALVAPEQWEPRPVSVLQRFGDVERELATSRDSAVQHDAGDRPRVPDVLQRVGD
jgi:hypothetical protein